MFCCFVFERVVTISYPVPGAEHGAAVVYAQGQEVVGSSQGRHLARNGPHL